MNNLAFQIYGLKKTGIFQSTWDTTKVSALGVEQAGVAASGSGWSSTTNLNTIGSTHTPGLTSNLVTSRTATAMQTYQIVCTITGTTGTIQVQFGNNTSAAISPGTTTITLMALNTNALTIIPSSSFDGNVRLSVKNSSSATNQIKLPLPNTGTYNIWVDWGDGTYDNITSYNSIKTLHTYPAPGEYTVKITGDRFNWQFGTSVNDRLKLKSISSWGKLKFSTYSFFGCSNVTMSGITDIPDLSSVISFQYLFGGCSKITTIGRLNEWNTSSVTIMNNTFDSCTLFNSNISNWNVSNVTNFSQMFINATSFNNGFASGVANQLPWNTMSSVSMAQMFQGAASFNSNLGTGTTPWDVSKVTTFTSMFYNAISFNNGLASGVAGTMAWNTINTTTMTSMFQGASAFNQNIGSWNVSNVNEFGNMFYLASKFNNGESADINNWVIKTTGTVLMYTMFQSAIAFNQPLGNWNTSNVTFMSSMFQSATAFNQDLSTWNVGAVTTMLAMFNSATAFTNGLNTNTNPITGLPGIDGWNINTTATSVNMSLMFQNADAFNRPIGNWNMTKVNNTSGMFANTSIFNQPLSNWERVGSTMGNVTNMSTMFQSASAFNQDISSWNVSKVTTFLNIFNGTTAFNNGGNSDINPITLLPGINGWNINTTATSVSMTYMFAGASAFNRYISGWNTSKVNTMNNMFAGASIFNNGYLSAVENQLTWDTSACTNMGAMFSGASAFNSNLGTGTTPWNVSKVTTFQRMCNAANFNNGDETTLSKMNDWSIGGDASVTTITMTEMFQSTTAFNRDISGWNMTKVNNTSNMFFTSIFNQPLANWERAGSTMSSVTDMSNMFRQNTVFNQPVGNWNTISVTNMSNMFFNSYAFDKNIGNWNVSSVNNFIGFMSGKTNLNFSSTNLDAIYNGWIVNGVKPNLTNVNFGSANYTSAGATGRAILTNPIGYNWTIIDGGQI